jgi:hypothetical protein
MNIILLCTSDEVMQISYWDYRGCSSSLSFLEFYMGSSKNTTDHSQDQIIPLPLGMQTYKTVDLTSPSLGIILFANHEFILISPEACFIGKCVEIYETAIRSQGFILSIQNCIIHDYLNDVRNEPAAILRFQQPTATEFFNDLAPFKRRAVKDWNIHCDEVTMSYNMGFVGVREDSSKGAASVFLDILLKFGVLSYVRTTRLGHFNDFPNSVKCTVLAIGRQSKIAWPL